MTYNIVIMSVSVQNGRRCYLAGFLGLFVKHHVIVCDFGTLIFDFRISRSFQVSVHVNFDNLCNFLALLTTP